MVKNLGRTLGLVSTPRKKKMKYRVVAGGVTISRHGTKAAAKKACGNKRGCSVKPIGKMGGMKRKKSNKKKKYSKMAW